MSQFFCVTAYGPAATRWLSFVIASNPQVFVAHGSYPLDSVVRGDFDAEKALLQQPINSDAVTRGRLADELVKTSSLSSLYDVYQRDFPDYQVYGNVHSYVLHELYAKEDLDIMGLKVINLIRDPINYIASHTQLVQDASHYAQELIDHYHHFYRSNFSKDYPDFEVDFSGFDSNDTGMLGHVLSCYTIKRQQRDLCDFRSIVDNIRMEDLVTDAEALKQACEHITGLVYAIDAVQSFIDDGELNSHRKSPINSAEQVYRQWSDQKREIFNYILTADDLAIYSDNGYRLDYVVSK